MNNMLSIALKQLFDRNCSERDLRRHLEKEFVELPELDKCINECIARLHELHLINDNRLAESMAQRYSHKGNRFITQLLRQKGVKDEIIASVLSRLDDEYHRALNEARIKGLHETVSGLEELEISLTRFLSGRGFSHDSIKTVLRNLSDNGHHQATKDSTRDSSEQRTSLPIHTEDKVLIV